MVVNVATSIEGSRVLLHGWLLKVLERELNVLISTLSQQIHEADEVVGLWVRWINLNILIKLLT